MMERISGGNKRGEVMKEVLILTDYRGFFATSLPPGEAVCSIDVKKIDEQFSDLGFLTSIKTFSELERNRGYEGVFVIYASSETPGLFYKNYIEDVLLGLRDRGAILLPEFKYFRCHHNKVYMEIVKDGFQDARLKTIQSRSFGVLSEIEDKVEMFSYPVIVKTSAGAGAMGVEIASDSRMMSKITKRLSKVSYKDAQWSWFRTSAFVKKLKTFYRKMTNNLLSTPYDEISEKIVVSNYIKNLQGDYKVLVFGEKYYLLYRKNRPGDFRASGSGLFEFPKDATDEVRSVLNLAKLAYGEIKQPLLSIDIGYDGKESHLIEFQCVYFGPYALQHSNGWFEYKSGEWSFKEGTSDLEHEYTRTIIEYISEVPSE
jgi:hypothetical protein